MWEQAPPSEPFCFRRTAAHTAGWLRANCPRCPSGSGVGFASPRAPGRGLASADFGDGPSVNPPARAHIVSDAAGAAFRVDINRAAPPPAPRKPPPTDLMDRLKRSPRASFSNTWMGLPAHIEDVYSALRIILAGLRRPSTVWPTSFATTRTSS